MNVAEKIAFGPLRRDLLSLYQRWDNDFATTRTLARSEPVTRDAMAAAYDTAQGVAGDVDFTIYTRIGMRSIGAAYLHGIDPRHGTAEFGIVIGEVEARSRGYGAEATRLVLGYAFTTLGLRNVMLRVYAYNLAGLHAYERAGFRVVGVRRQCHRMGGRLCDVVSMEATHDAR